MRFWWCASLLLALAGCNSGIAEREAERRLRQRLPEIIGPAEEYRVSIHSGSDSSVIRGRLGQVTIEGRQVRVGNAWPVDQLTVHLERVRVDTRKKVLREVGSARFEARVGEQTLTRYLEEDAENLRSVAVSLDEGSVRVAGRFRVLRVWAPFNVSGSLFLLDRHRVGFRVDSVRAVGIPIPDPVERYLEQRLNPVMDLSDTMLSLELTGVRIEPGAVVVTGVPRLEEAATLAF
ncbi:MAG: DUF2993 domain-containing protein [Armatimonadota bacterium]|nr:DUF2993 domain-containing protein [Armatimonadota bacterium]